MDEVVTRRLGRGEEEEVSRFGEAFDDPIDIEATSAFLSDERHHLLVAYVNGDPAGFVSATEVMHPDKSGPELFLNEIGVIERFRRRGAGSALIEALQRLGRSRECRLIWVLTDEGNPAAMAMYAEVGGVWDGTRQVMFEYDLTAE